MGDYLCNGRNFWLLLAMAFGKKNIYGWFGLVAGLIFIGLSMQSLYIKVPSGLPKELTKDGVYEVRIVDTWTKDGNEWVGVLLLKEEGETDIKPSKYYRFPASRFKNKADVVLGIPITIKLRTSQELIVVK